MSDCIFCKILQGEIPSMKVYEDDICIAMMDIGPATKGHVLILPREHRENLLEMDEKTAGHLLMVAKETGARQKEKLGAKGFHLVQNNGEAAGQTVLHFHIHVIPRFGDPSEMALWTPLKLSMEELADIQKKLQ